MSRTLLRMAAIWLVVCLGIVGFAQPNQAAADDPQSPDALARHLLEKAGLSHGVCVVLGSGDGALAAALLKDSPMAVCAVDRDAANVVKTQETLDAAGPFVKAPGVEAARYVQRVFVEQRAYDPLPYAENTVDLVLAVGLDSATLSQVSPNEVFRVLCPGGKAVLGLAQTAGDGLEPRQLKDWLAKANVKSAQVDEDDFGVWAVLTKPPLEGVDDWSHWEHGPDNNPASTDGVIRAPYISQWMGEPYYIAMPAITTAAGGRTFLAMGHIAHHEREEPWLNTLLARNGYNGEELWRLRLPDGYMAHRSAFIATDDTFYMIDLDGVGCLMLDPATGARKDQIEIPELEGEWKWIALQDGVLYVLAGGPKDSAETTIVRSEYTHWSWGELSRGYYTPRVPWGFGTTLLAYDLARKRVVWSHGEDAVIDSRAMAMGDGHVFFYCPDSRLGCLSQKTGEPAWVNPDPKIREIVEEVGVGLGSTPGFRSTCYAMYTPDVLVFAPQTNMNVVGVSPRDGSFMWSRKKITSNPNLLYADGHILVGIGPNGSTQVLDPLTGKTLEDLDFAKRSCARLTATADSFFCRGMPEGVTRYDRINKRILFNGAFRPACNDGVLPANGLLYIGPWLCDCNLTLMGTVALCSAGDFSFASNSGDVARLETPGAGPVAEFAAAPDDWTDYRGNTAHTGASTAEIPLGIHGIWHWTPRNPNTPTAAVAAGERIFVAGSDGRVHAIDANTGNEAWQFATAGPIMASPAVWQGRVFVGSGDGYVYALEAATGRLLWRFRAAPIERRMMVYGAMGSTWPVNSGVLVDNGVAYVAAGIIDYDGTYMYALDAATGAAKWQNATSGHLDPALRKGVSAQGFLTACQGRLWMPGGNVISPGIYDLASGAYAGSGPGDGSPRTNRGEEVGVFGDDYVLFGGRLRYSATENVVDPGSFGVVPASTTDPLGQDVMLCRGKIPPVWDNDQIVMVDGRHTPVACYRAADILAFAKSKDPKRFPAPEWKVEAPGKGDVLALALAKNAVVATVKAPGNRALQPRYFACALSRVGGSLMWQHELPGAPMAGGLTIDRAGRIVVAMADGSLVCGAGGEFLRSHIEALAKAGETLEGRTQAIDKLRNLLPTIQDAENRRLIITRLAELGEDVIAPLVKSGCLTAWQLLGPVAWDGDHPLDAALIGEPNVDGKKPCNVGGKTREWRSYETTNANGMVDLALIYGPMESCAVYAYAEVNLPSDADLLLKIGTNDGYKCWFNGAEVGRFDGGRGYTPDQDALPVKARKGTNTVLVKVIQMGGAWKLGVRLTDTEGRPLDLTALPAKATS